VTLRARLLLALLAMALLPAAVLTLFTLDQLGRSTEHWFRPGVDRALESALQVSKTAMTRMEAGALAASERWATEWTAQPLTVGRRTELRMELREEDIDFVQVFRLARGGWRLDDQLAPAGVMLAAPPALDSTIAPALAAGHLVRSARGALAGVALTRDGRAVLTGYWVPPDFFEDVERVEQGASFYRRLGVVVSVQRQYVWMLLAALVLVLAILGVLLATALARGMSRPLTELSSALERVAAGDLATRVKPAGAHEVRRLGDAFNVMTGRLERAREQLVLAEREAAWREVARRLAHEIKNPLTPMRLSLHRLQRRVAALPEEPRRVAEESLAAMLEEVEHLSRLAEQFAQYARLPEPGDEPFELPEVIRRAAALHEPESVALTLNPEHGAMVRGDRLLLSRAIQNLLLNAREASPAGVPVEIRLAVVNGQAVVEILDRGSGLNVDVRDRVFEPYVSSKQRGSGLGLSLVRDIATQHHGTVTLENREGGGACARLTLPLMESTPERR